MPLRHQGNAQDMAARERRTTPHFSCGGMGLRGRMTAGDKTMTTLDRTFLDTTGAARPAVALRLARKVVDTLRAWRNRRQIYRLAEMSEWELADIGLTRADLSVAWNSPMSVDPTARLGALADARAGAELRRAVEMAARTVC